MSTRAERAAYAAPKNPNWYLKEPLYWGFDGKGRGPKWVHADGSEEVLFTAWRDIWDLSAALFAWGILGFVLASVTYGG